MNIHLIDNDVKIAYFPDSKRFFEVNDSAYAVIDMINQGLSDEKINKEIDIEINDLKEFRDSLKSYSIRKPNDIPVDKCSCFKDKTLDKLAINITNSCNLNCLYCYACGGTYNTKVEPLTKETVDRTLEIFYKRYEKINTVQLFGGEPLIDMDMIAYISDKVRQIDNDRNITTNIGIVTNGTLINDKFIDIIKKYDIKVTVSYDGDKTINDILRKNKAGESVSDIVYNNAKLLYDTTEQLTSIEVTYTKQHVDNNIKIIDLIKNMHKDFPNIVLNIAAVACTNTCSCKLDNLSVLSESIDDYFKLPDKDNYVHAFVEGFRNVSRHSKKHSDFICQAGIDMLTVGVNGDIYPCFMLNGHSNLKMGNVFDEDFFNSDSYKNVIKYITKITCKKVNHKCENCTYNTICTSCLGMNEMFSGKLEINDDVCQFHKDIYETTMKNLVLKNNIKS